MTVVDMQLTVVGAGTTLPAKNRSPSCHLVRFGERAVVFDLGSGALAGLARAGLDYRDIETVFISHLHPDHTLDLIMLLQAANATPGWTRTAPLTVAGCRGLKQFISQLLDIFRDARPETYELLILELDVGYHRIAGMKIEVGLTGHTSNSLAFRVETGGVAFCYSGDAVDPLVLNALARNADIFVCECSFRAGHATEDHFTADVVARVASGAAVRRLVLVHTYPDTFGPRLLEEVALGFSGPVTLAVDGLTIDARKVP
ncbi:MAG: MBL fold metallo-hydrolase [Rhizobiaceae bacterium]|nr:MBL fold metallo-hydrolase [Rhizobiaceae bacterium]